MYMYNYTRRIPLAFISPCHFPFSPPLCPLLLTWNPPSCDRNRPPRSQVACKLTPLVPPLTQTLPLPNSQNPNWPSASLRRPQEYSGFFCPEQLLPSKNIYIYIYTCMYNIYIYVHIYILVISESWSRSGGPWCTYICTRMYLLNPLLYIAFTNE
jgi:hypothetical protein